MRKKSCIVTAMVLTMGAWGNNIQVGSVALTDNMDGSAQVSFDLGWENSWKGGPTSNWDAAWVFVKVRSTTTGVWTHAHLSSSGHIAPPDAQVTAAWLSPFLPPPEVPIPHGGAFIHRIADGSGNVSYTGIELRWNHGAQGISFADVAEVRVFAIEMVYVNEGAFAAGGIGTEEGFTLTTINTPSADTPPNGSGSLGGQAGGYPTGQVAPVPEWPNGFNAFYCMKYEVSQQGFVDFLNTLTFEQQYLPGAPSGTTVFSGTSGWRNGMVVLQTGAVGVSPATYACDLNGNGIGSEVDDGGDLALVGMPFPYLCAYLDWAGLRPMSELEYEKACRGPMPPVENEFPWGSALVTNAAYGLENMGTPSEGISGGYATTNGNAAWSATMDTISLPLRVGIFAANPALNGRPAAGAGYYGVMELAGNAGEYCITLSDSYGSTYSGLHGDGMLNTSGLCDVYGWPDDDFFGHMLRGGHGGSPVEDLRIAHRNLSILTYYPMGGRGVRTAP